MSALSLILLSLALWVALILVIRTVIVPWLAHAPMENALSGIVWRFGRLYCRVIHRVTWVGLETLREKLHAGPLIVVSNHTGAIDPVLIQCGCRFHVRWMMASDMMASSIAWLWQLQQVIPVDRDGRDSGPAREAIRHVQGGDAVGIFPEGRIVQPPRQIRPFFQGVGLIVARAKAPVLLVWVSGTPDTRDTLKSLLQPSRARVEYLEVIDFKGEKDAHVITEKLRERISKDTGWSLNDEPMPKGAPPE